MTRQQRQESWREAEARVAAQERRDRAKRFLQGTFLVLLLIALCFVGCVGTCSLGNQVQYGEGTRTAPLLKVSRKGLFWKTWEGQMAIFAISDSGAANPYEFSIPDPALAAELAKHEGKQVRIYYTQALTGVPWLGATDTYVYKFEVIP